MVYGPHRLPSLLSSPCDQTFEVGDFIIKSCQIYKAFIWGFAGCLWGEYNNLMSFRISVFATKSGRNQYTQQQRLAKNLEDLDLTMGYHTF